jgi:hypothetical protein
MVTAGAGEAATLSTNRSSYGHLVLFILKKKGILTEGNACCNERWESDHVWWAEDGVRVYWVVDLASGQYL